MWERIIWEPRREIVWEPISCEPKLSHVVAHLWSAVLERMSTCAEPGVIEA